ncbi:MAG: hypothetical protein UW49_C0014G0040, partial [Candidatus Giovannonibacteria bacterium GW2011_GWB1_44_23]
LAVNNWLGFFLILSALIIPQIIFKCLFNSRRLDEIEEKAEDELSKKYEQ